MQASFRGKTGLWRIVSKKNRDLSPTCAWGSILPAVTWVSLEADAPSESSEPNPANMQMCPYVAKSAETSWVPSDFSTYLSVR